MPSADGDALTMFKLNGCAIVVCQVFGMPLLTKLETDFRSAAHSDPLATSLRVFVDTSFAAMVC